MLGSAYVRDTKLRHAGAITWLLRRRTHAGDIVILHEGSKSRTWTPEVLDALIPYWKKKGLEVGTLGELLRKSANR